MATIPQGPNAPPPVVPPPGAPGMIAAAGSGTPPTPPGPPDWRKPAFDFLADSTKQMITVATGVVTATVLFSKDLDSAARNWALAAWIVLTLSVCAGIFALFNMSGNLHRAAEGIIPHPDVNAGGIKSCSKFQVLAFVAGVFLLVPFGFHAIRVQPADNSKPTTINCIVPNMPAPVIIQVPALAPNEKKSTGKKASTKKQLQGR